MSAKNFKSWRDTGDLQIAPLTGFFGANSSGKTSLLQLLLLLKQTAESLDRNRVLHTGDEHSLVDVGTFSDLIHAHQMSDPLEMALSWSLPEPLTVKDPSTRSVLFSTDRLAFESVIRYGKERPLVKRFQYRFGDYTFGMKSIDSKNGGRDAYAPIPDENATEGFVPKRNPGRPYPLPSPVKCYGFPDEAIGFYQNTGFLPEFALQFEQRMSRIFYLGPLREYPRRSYVWSGGRPTDVGRRGEGTIAALLAAQAEGRKELARTEGKRKLRRPIQEIVPRWMKRMGLVHSFSLEPIALNREYYEVRIRKSEGTADVLITDVGFGVSQILPVLVLCYYVPEGSTVILEQPEIHLHPSVQAGLADVLIDVVQLRKIQIIVESHSDHLVRRIQRRIAEGALDPQDAALYFCEMGEDGASQAERLRVDLTGYIENWPKGFFGDPLEESLKMAEAAMRRARKAAP
ncbi:DUF3696 domain-containing protein [Candidatus Poribacteria bacterium]|nr:DUF3696 domain-containing protein [Candidatus Poribacteria bacterium]